MAGTKNPSTLRAAALGAVLAGVLFALVSTGCKSEPCIGEGCPSACLDATCDGSAAEPEATGGTGAVLGGGRFSSCATDASCDTAHGFSCVAGKCRHPCRTHFDCVGVGSCAPLAGANGTYCEPFAQTHRAGGYYTRCPLGV